MHLTTRGQARQAGGRVGAARPPAWEKTHKGERSRKSQTQNWNFYNVGLLWLKMHFLYPLLIILFLAVAYLPIKTNTQWTRTKKQNKTDGMSKCGFETKWLPKSAVINVRSSKSFCRSFVSICFPSFCLHYLRKSSRTSARITVAARHNKLHCSFFMFRLAVLCRNHDRGDDILDWVMLFWQTNPCQTMWPSSQHAANIHSEQPGSLLSCWCGKRGRRSLFWEERKSCCDSKPWLHGK